MHCGRDLLLLSGGAGKGERRAVGGGRHCRGEAETRRRNVVVAAAGMLEARQAFERGTLMMMGKGESYRARQTNRQIQLDRRREKDILKKKKERN